MGYSDAEQAESVLNGDSSEIQPAGEAKPVISADGWYPADLTIVVTSSS